MTFYCGGCKKECTPTVVDDGIGPYEYWGAPGVDKNECCVSDCCEAVVFTNEECTCEYTLRDMINDAEEDKAARMEDLR